MRGHLNLDGETLNLDGGTLTLNRGRVPLRPPYNLSTGYANCRISSSTYAATPKKQIFQTGDLRKSMQKMQTCKPTGYHQSGIR